MGKSKFNFKFCVLLPIVLLVTIFLVAVPVDFFGIPGLTVVQQRVIALFVFAALMWMFEIIPNWTTSLLVIVFSLLTVSNKGIGFLCKPEYGQLVGYTDIMKSFADPVVMLFLGGFVLAIMAEKYGLDVTLARHLLKPFGTKPKMVLLGFLIVISIFSMFMSNTATAAMMLAFLAPVLAVLPAGDKGKVGLALAIPIAANLGGIGTPIGTPPNATAVKFLAESGYEVTFGEWMIRMVPYVAIMIFVAWILLQFFFPFKSDKVVLEIPENKRENDWKSKVVWITFVGTILLWATESITGINSNVVALIPLGVLTCTGIFSKEDIKQINWSVLWLVAGGFALGTCLQGTGLAKALIQAIPFGSMSVVLVLVIAGLVCYFLSNFISNSATAALLIPILIVVAEGMADPAAASHDSFFALGGTHAMICFIAVCASIAMLFPISTPPNAIASSTGLVETKQMARVGIIVGVIGFVLGFFWLTTLFPFKSKHTLETNSSEYALVALQTPSSAQTLSPNGKVVIELFKKAAQETDKIYWQQNFGSKDSLMAKLEGKKDAIAFANINYGPWDRNTDTSFVEGYGARPLGANFYPADMTVEEFDAFADPAKNSPYTIIRRNDAGALETVWYHDAYKANIDNICNYLQQAADTTIKASVREYLLKKIDALRTDNYYDADIAWLNMTDSRMDLVLGPNVAADDKLFGRKASFSAFVVLKDMYRTSALEKISAMLPELQESLPVDAKYKSFNPGTSSSIFSCDAIYYAGNGNAGFKVIAINLPYDEKVQKEKGTRTILFQNVIAEKFFATVAPTGNTLLTDANKYYLDADAFYWNIVFREVAQGLGVKQTLSGTSVEEALGSEALTIEKVKANALGTMLACRMIDQNQIPNIIGKKNAVATFVASVLRSTRFGAVGATGKANIIVYNWLRENGAITLDLAEKAYDIDYAKAEAAISSLVEKVLVLQAEGDAAAASEFVNSYSNVDDELAAAIVKVEKAKIPVDIIFKQ